MPTVTIRLDDATDARLKRRLERSGETLSEFIRQAVVNQLDASARTEPRLTSLMRVLEEIEDSGATDHSQTYKTRIQERLLAKHRR